MLQPDSGNVDVVYDALKAAENNYTVYRKQDLPDRFRIKNNTRVPEILVVAEAGYSITTRDRFESRGVSGGAHGYDPLDPDMNAFFLASGPAFKSGLTIEAFENIHIYEMLCEILGLNPAPNDGNSAVLEPILAK
jgi:predicted AlkP superfamily pyrophosphatase or phosphodiesterase